MDAATNLLSRYKHLEIGPGKYRANLLNESDAKQWMEEYVSLTNTNWSIFKARSNTPHYICSLEYNCHHTSYRRVDPNKNAKGKSKNCGCRAKLKIAIKHTTKDTRKKDKYVKEGMPAFIEVSMNHNHSLTSGESLGYLRPNRKVRDEFDTYFDSGLEITESIQYHESKLELKYGVGSVELANTLLNPKYRTVSFWYNKWQALNLGPRHGEGVLEKLQEKQKIYEKDGIIVKFQENPFAVIVVTKIMQRAHSLPFSKDIVFTDSTSCCDSLNHSITFMLTPCSIGAVPLGVIITKGQTENDYIAGFQLIKNNVPNSFCGEGYPRIFMTDDSDAERNALKFVWPKCKPLLCRFHVCQSVWRWLWEKKNNVPIERRQLLYKDFQAILEASTNEAALEAFKNAIDNSRDYSEWSNYITKYWNRKEYWALAYRDGFTHGHQTNNFSEITVRLFKDVVLNRNKAYNAIALVDFSCTLLEEYYQRRLRNFINNRDSSNHLFLNKQLRKIEHLKKKDIKQNSSSVYVVPSSQSNGTYYDVDIQAGFCSCEAGRLGRFCKHQTEILHFFGVQCTNSPAASAETRLSMAKLAFGDNIQPLSFYEPFFQKPSTNHTIVTESDEILPQQNNLDPINCNNNTEGKLLGSTDMATSAEDSIDFKNVIDLLLAKNSQFGTSTSTAKLFCQRLKKVNTSTAWESFLCTAGSSCALRYRQKSTIKVQPTALNRRKGITRGSKRRPLGRPASGEPVKKRLKKKHNLSQNVKSVQPNAIKHGSLH